MDGTVGSGGHAAALLENYDIGMYIGLDQDTTALEIASKTLSQVRHCLLLSFSM